LAIKQPKSASYLPTLDGWRAIAVLLVLCFHGPLIVLGPFNDSFLHRYGSLGVDIFFAISGLLICSRLLREEDRLGKLSLSRFYIRRAFRILPPAFFFLAVLGTLSLTHHLPISLGEWLGAMFFFRNYSSLCGPPSTGSYYTSHFWSLAVEEHFYLILPLLLLLTHRRFRLAAMLSLTALVVLLRAVLSLHRPLLLIALHTEVRIDALFIPAIVAVLLHTSPGFRAGCKKWLRFWPVLLLIFFGWFLPGLHSPQPRFILAPFFLTAIVTGSVLNSADLPGRFLELAPLRFIGRISYSLYLWQMLFFVMPSPGGDPWYHRYPWQALCTLACALFSYYLIEQPFVKLGSRFAPAIVPGREAETIPANPNPAI